MITLFGLIFSGLLGLAVGSFLNVVTLRLPQGKSLFGRSHCPACGVQLTTPHLFPVISWVLLRGKCASCKTKIHWRYPVFELLVGVLFVFAFWVLNSASPVMNLELVLLLAKALVAICLAVVVFTIDLEHYLILDSTVLAGSLGLLGILVLQDIFFPASFLSGATLNGLAMAGILMLLFYSIWRMSAGKWLGFGDVKFMLPFGLALGFPLGFLGLGLASVLGSVIGIAFIIFGKANWSSKLPFGVFLSVALVAVTLYGAELWLKYIDFANNFLLQWYN